MSSVPRVGSDTVVALRATEAAGPIAAPGSHARTLAPPIVRLERASVRYDDVVALREVSLTLHRGERLALVGANGSGKTTLLRLLHGLARCSGARSTFPLEPEGRQPVTAMLFQRPFLLSLSVRWNILPVLWLHGVRDRDERERRCLQALRRVGLEHLARRPARSLSGGQQQRLALARAWVIEPDVLLLDEPTANLDPGAKREVEALVGEIAASGVTVVISTHNLGQAKRLGTRVAYLESGRVVVDLPVDRFFTDRLPREAEQFLNGELPWT